MLRDLPSSADSTSRPHVRRQRPRLWNRILLAVVLTMGATSLWNVTEMASTLPAQEPSRSAAAVPPVPGKLHLVYVPVDDLEALLTRDRAGVFLSREEFDK